MSEQRTRDERARVVPAGQPEVRKDRSCVQQALETGL